MSELQQDYIDKLEGQVRELRQRMEAPQTVKDSLMVERIADCLIADHIDLMNECESLRARVAELERLFDADDMAEMDALRHRVAELENLERLLTTAMDHKQSELAACEKERDEAYCDVEEADRRLAVSQHYAQQLREALEKGLTEIEAVTCDPEGNVCFLGDELRGDMHILQDGIAILRKALSLPNDTSALDAMRKDAERRDAFPQAHRLALELECLLMDCKDTAVVSKWWNSSHEALEQWREFCAEEAAIDAAMGG